MAEIDIKELCSLLEDPAVAVADAERAYTEKINEIASLIVERGSIRVLLLSGPSGSGKTTTANLICDRIKALGERSVVVSLDNFYRDANDPEYPILENGERDFESPYALDIPSLIVTLADIISGREFSVPRYDFKIGGRVEISRYPSFADGCVIIEGIHALNPLLSDPFPADAVLKLFVSVSTNINDGSRRILSGKKLRFVRRMVRDSLYRGADVKRTLAMWENVLDGEEKYLYPFKELADVRFDTFHTFEPAVMKPYAMRLLTNSVTDQSIYAEIIADALARLPEYPSQLVPESSLIREFIPGGIYEDLY